MSGEPRGGPKTKLQHKKDIMEAVVNEFMREADKVQREKALPRIIKPHELRKGQEVTVITGDYHLRVNAFRGVVLGFSKDSYTDDGVIEMTGLEHGIYSKDRTIVLHKEAE